MSCATMPSMSQLPYTAADVGRMLGLHRETIVEHCRDGRIKAEKRGRYWWIQMREIKKLTKVKAGKYFRLKRVDNNT